MASDPARLGRRAAAVILVFLASMVRCEIRGAEVLPERQDSSEGNVPHAALIRSWNAGSYRRGERLYQSVCLPCHGKPGEPGSLPASRAFWKEPFKNGNDPLGLYKTLSQGLGQMPAWPFVSPELRYDVIHYLREGLVKSNNPAAYFEVTPAYLESLPRPLAGYRKSAEMLEFEKGPKYLRMDFGPVLFWTVQVATNNIAYKGIAIRLDDGPGGISRGRAWMLYDQDTLRLAAGWSGDGFLDWKGIAFDGSHGTHASLVGDLAFANPAGPGWAEPGTGRFDDTRSRGLDGHPYGPLPREWARFKGVYLHGGRGVLSYSVGDANLLEQPGCEVNGEGITYVRRIEIGRSSRELAMRVAPQSVRAFITGSPAALLTRSDGFHVLRVPADATPAVVEVRLGGPRPPGQVGARNAFRPSPPMEDAARLVHGGPPRWNQGLTTRGAPGTNDGPFIVDTITAPQADRDPWKTWMRFGGFDFFPDGRRAAIGTWNGDVWLVGGIDGGLEELNWRRIASGLFQPLGLRIVNGVIHVGCRDQIARLHDLNGDDEIDYIECFNNDHQVTEHFHEFAMGLQTDRDGNFYYAKSARHALPPLVPHHGTLLKVTRDGGSTEIVASGFRAANGVCVNDDGTFLVTDQEGHWTPKNRINLVRPGGFYGNMWSFKHPTSSSDDAVEPPLVWITNDKDRSPAELLRVPPDQWGPLGGALLSLSYGTGRIFLVPYETDGNRIQGGVVELPMPAFPTGVMRGRFHPGNGHLYVCGMFAWAGNQTQDGGFYRIRYTGMPVHVPVGLHAHGSGLDLVFAEPLDIATAQDPANYRVRTWSLRRSADYGSKHLNDRRLRVSDATLSDDGRVVRLELPDIRRTDGMEVEYRIRARDGSLISQSVHNTIHFLRPDGASRPRDDSR